MNRFIYTWLYTLVLSCSLSHAAKHGLAEAMRQFDSGLFDNQLIVVKVQDAMQLNVQRGGAFIGGAELAVPSSAKLSRLFLGGENKYDAQRKRSMVKGKRLARLENYLYLETKHPYSRAEMRSLLKSLHDNSAVEFVYFEPKFENATFTQPVVLRTEPPVKLDPPGNFEAQQYYLDASPIGVDARFAWDLQGGTGEDVRVVDVEQGWNTAHIDLNPVFWSNGLNTKAWNDHGTAVWGEVASKNDGIGTTGIAFGSQFGFSGAEWTGDWNKLHISIAKALDQANENLREGDIIIIEQHAPGPDASKMTAVEYFDAIFDAVSAASADDVIVVAAAGNGSSDFDSANYKGAFDINVRDSGAILVGAGASPGVNQHKRLGFSNYGKRVDAFAYGENVTTTGYGDLHGKGKGGVDLNMLYTKRFSGTSSATPIVAGALAAFQGILKARGERLTPELARRALRETGTPSPSNDKENIGNLPNLKALYSWWMEARRS